MIDDKTSPRGVPLFALALALAAANGATDVASFIRLGGVFASVMTGNLVLLGLAVERESGSLSSHAVTAIAGYIVGVTLGALICRGTRDGNELWPTCVTTTLAVELCVVVGFTIGWELANGRATGASQLVLLAVAAIAMGLQSEAMRNVGAPLSTTYLTGTLTGAVASLFSGGRHRRADWLSAGVLGCAAAGAVVGAALIDASPDTFPILPVASVAGVVAAVMTIGLRQPSLVKRGNT
jgi:uncharacterized membrane protein YoaK (UPF0700 family)